MSKTPQYPKRLIEVDLPIRRISSHARREKSIRHGHISTLHIWWARRPLAACRAVVCASLWPDPADPLCPESFRTVAKREMRAWAKEHLALLSPESYQRFNSFARTPTKLDDNFELRGALLDFIADFANWCSGTTKEYLDTGRALTQASHEALGGEPGTRPLVVDPFAGGGSIPLEALRVEADAFASDLNPVPVLLNRVVLDYMPKYGQRLADDVKKWGDWIKTEAEKKLAECYPKDPDGATPIAYLWARTVRCEGPGCGVKVPLVRNWWLGKKANRSVALQIEPNSKAKRVGFRIITRQGDDWVDQADPRHRIASPTFAGTVKSGAATCPCCGYTTPNARVRVQLSESSGGAATATLTTVVVLRPGDSGRTYRLATDWDEMAIDRAVKSLALVLEASKGGESPLPDERIPRERPSPNARGLSAVVRMGVERFGDLFTPRQALALVTLNALVQRAARDLPEAEGRAVRTVLALSVGKIADLANSCCLWEPVAECPRHLFSRHAAPIVWDFAEGVPIGESSGSWGVMIDRFRQFVATSGFEWNRCEASLASATAHPLPDDSAAAFITDPPYYDAVPYGDLSDFFYVWLRRALKADHRDLFSTPLVEKDEEAIWNPSRIYSRTGKPKDEAFYESQMGRALAEGRRVTSPGGIGVVVFAHKSTAGWEAILSALIDAGWIATASWPIDTEMGSRVNAMGTASLASSIHIVCRPRENADGSIRTDDVGDWREVLRELPRRIHEWMPRLAEEGVVGADAIFSCLGPALEVFSRYSRVEKTSGEVVTLKEYLEHVWAAVSKEALSMIFRDPETAGLEPDARLTAMWLWTLAGPTSTEGAAAGDDAEDDAGEDDEEGGSKKKEKGLGFSLEFDAARKIAQGLGATLENLTSVVEVKGDKARLLSVGERARALFATSDAPVTVAAKKAAKKQQMKLFEEEIESAAEEQGWDASGAPTAGKTALDRVHQAMLLFGTGRSEALKRFLVEEGAGRQASFWKLAQALSALYPPGCDEKRWVDGVLVRKKGLGF